MHADLVVLNARVMTLDAGRPRATAVACAKGRLLLVGERAQAREVIGPRTEVVDAAGALLVPGFHDAHVHLLRYARAGSYLACGQLSSLAELQAALRRRAAELPGRVWLRASGYDERRLIEPRHPDRHDLDAAVADHPVRLQHRSLHLDVLNTLGLRLTGLLDSTLPQVERDTGEATGRVYHGADLLHELLPRPNEAELAIDVRRASEQLLAWGITSVQDATATNALAEWQLFQRLAEAGHLRQRTWVMLGARHLADREHGTCANGRAGSLASWPRPGHAKVMLNEATSDPREVGREVRAAHAAGWPVAIHAVSEAEVATAIAALQHAGPRQANKPDRIEHGGVIAEEWLAELKSLGVTVVGQPGLIYDRGDVYTTEYPEELHGWVHRAGSLLKAGVGYAIGSDAPLTQPWPGLAVFAATTRRTRGGNVLGSDEALTAEQALAALTLGPAQAVGMGHALGRLQPGALADFAVLEPDALEPDAPSPREARLTVLDGRVVHRHL